MAVNECYGRHRRRQRLTQLLAGVRPAAPPESDLDLRSLVEALPYRERTVVVLHYGHGLTDEWVRVLSAIEHGAEILPTAGRANVGD